MRVQHVPAVVTATVAPLDSTQPRGGERSDRPEEAGREVPALQRRDRVGHARGDDEERNAGAARAGGGVDDSHVRTAELHPGERDLGERGVLQPGADHADRQSAARRLQRRAGEPGLDQDRPSNRVPAIANTMKDLGWAPKVDMPTALRRIFDAYRAQLDDARALAE